MTRLNTLLSVVCLLVALSFAVPAAAYDQPLGLNLGFTSFMDGGPPAGPGWYFTEYLQLYNGDHLRDYPNPAARHKDVDAWVNLNQLIYQSDQALLLGGKWGLDVIVPLVCIDADPAAPDNGAGVGDVTVGPFLQWDPIMGANGPVLMHRVELQMIVPVGKYDDEKALNPGANHFSFNPYWAGTWFVTPKLTATCRLHYLWNDKNDDPFIGYGPLDDLQAGEVFHANFAASYEVLPKQLRVGANGYYLRQISDSEWDGPGDPSDPDSREQVLGIGPGAMWSFSQDMHLFFNMYFESHVKNRPEGERFNLRFVYHF
ncbi:MAG: transporter [Sedimentisphaerales bacterium]|nr:transporter [Sedimentisphaerales bacterium]